MFRHLLVCFFAVGSLAYATNHVTPESYGAVGDGTTDDSSAFNSALAYSAANNVHVLLGAKTYYIGSTLNLSSNMTMIGQGSKLTTLKFGAITNALTTSSSATAGTYSSIRMEGFTLETNYRDVASPPSNYNGLTLYGVDYPIVRDVEVTNVSQGYAILFARCRYANEGDISALSAVDCYNVNGPTTSHPVIHISSCEELFIKDLSVINSYGPYPADQRDAVSCVDSTYITIQGIRGIQIDSMLDIGNSQHCLFENIFGSDVSQIPIYANNSTRRCTFRNGHFENTDFGIYVFSSDTTLERPELDRFNVFENFTFHNVGRYEYSTGNFESTRPGIIVRSATDDDEVAPHDNIFRNIHFVDDRSTVGLSKVVDEDMNDTVKGRNTYTHVTVDTTETTTPLAVRVVAPSGDGSNLDGMERRLGRYSVDFSSTSASAWLLSGFTIKGIDKIYGVQVSLNTEASGDAIQYINVIARNLSGNTFDLVVRTVDGSSLQNHVSGPLFIIYEAIGE